MGDGRVEGWVADLYAAPRKAAPAHAVLFSMGAPHPWRDLHLAIDALVALVAVGRQGPG